MPRRPRRLTLTAILSLAALSATTGVTQPSVAAPGAADTSDAARGKVLTGLTPAAARRCGGHGFSVEGHPELCTHGPDLAPVGRDVRKRRSSGELRVEAAHARSEAGGPDTTAGAAVGTTTPPTNGTGAIVCDGDGVSGPRTQVLYVRAAGVPSRAGVNDLIASSMVNMDGEFNASAQETGGSRHVRFVTEPSGDGPCQLSIPEVVISDAGDDSFSNTIAEVKVAGWDATAIGRPRKFLMMVDATLLCGIASLYDDDRPVQANANNAVMGMYSRTDQGCWNYAESHEQMHNLGGVQDSAPHSTLAGHCWDEYDVMCYEDGGPVATMQYLCPSSQEFRLDCNHDDFFHTSPPAGSYLATHWNTANSRFLIDPALTVDTTAPTAPTVSVTSPVTPTNQGAVSVTGTAEPGSTVKVSVDDGNAGTAAVKQTLVAQPGTFSTSLGVSTLADGVLTVSVTATDEAGNASAPGVASATKDVALPSIAGLTATASTHGSPATLVSGSVSEDASVLVSATDGTSTRSTNATIAPDRSLNASLDLTSLVDGPVTITARATDGVGNVGTATTSTTRDSATPPSSPTGVSATAGNRAVSVSFSAPAATGGAPVTGYRVVSSTGAQATGSASPLTVTGLANGAAVTFTVSAVNRVGESAASAPSAAVTPKGTSAVTFNALPSKVLAGTTITLAGTVTRTDASVPFQPVTIKVRYDNGTVSTLTRVTPTSTGAFSFRYLNRVNFVYWIVYEGDAFNLGATSLARRVFALAKVTASAPSGPATSNQVITGRVFPSKPGKIVTLYRVTSSGARVKLGAARLSSTSTFRFSLRLPRGYSTLAIVIANTPNNAAGGVRFRTLRT